MNTRINFIVKKLVHDAIYDLFKGVECLPPSFFRVDGTEIPHGIEHGTQLMKDLEFAVTEEYQRILDILEG